MADFNPNTKSLLYGLSDFWLHFFKDKEVLDYFYKGAEIQIGQSYLDLLALLLNNSTQDATVFNKEYFKYISIKESDVQFTPGVTPSADRYFYTLPDKVVEVPYLNNKILFPTAALDKVTDYFVGDDGVDRRLEFKVDPTNAYYELIVGSDIASIRVRANLAGPDGGLITVHFNDNGSSNITLTRTDYAIQIDYDGPFNTATHSANALVQAINLDANINPFITAEVVNAVINGSPVGTGFPTPLQPGDNNVLDNFAKRKITAYYGGSFMCSLVPSWTRAGVRKGDTLRLRTSRGIGVPVELDIDLLQGSKLFVNENTPITEDNETSVDFAVLRTPANHTSINEPFSDSGVVIAAGIGDGDIDSALRKFTVPTANTFAEYNRGDIINIATGPNIGAYEIIDVLDDKNVILAAVNLTTGTGYDWGLYSNVNVTWTGTSASTTLSNSNESQITTDYSGDFSVDASGGNDVTGSILKIVQNGSLIHYQITGYIGAQILKVRGLSPVVPTGVWAIADMRPASAAVILSPPVGWPTPGTLKVNARRLYDGQLVQENVDYRFNVDTGILEALSVWETSLGNTVTYDFRISIVQTVTPVQQGVLGTITPGSPNVFTALDANFLPEHVGFAINISGSGLTGSTNNGTHYIASILSTTSVELTPAKRVPTTLDPNNGSLNWTLHMRGSSIVNSDSAVVNEISFWAPDILVDRLNLYNTFGYLINKYSRSSEAYRAFIRGVFQLFMLGPTLERFESAINILAGLPIIRDDNEILIDYKRGDLFSGTANGNLFGSDGSFTTTAYVFTAADLNKQLFISSGFNLNHTYTITAIVNNNKVLVTPTPTTDVNLSWELRDASAPQSVITNRRVYDLARAIPIKDKYLDSSNYGVLTLRSFEVISSIFLVTDYIETPRWWEDITIPPELWENESLERRISTPQLFENTLNPSDDGRIGDPGFYVGGSSDGFVPPSDLVRAGAADGTLLGDPLYPASNTTYFQTPTGNFTSADLGNLLNIATIGTFRIKQIISPTQVEIESFVQQPLSTSGLTWEIRSGALALRHKAAFVILDKFLKQHLFTVSYDFSTVSLIDLNILTDLKNLIFNAKPAYTYLVLNPYALFNELIRVEELYTHQQAYYLGGSGGDIIAANENPLLIIGSSWCIGQWFRQVEQLSNFAAPTTTVTNVLGIPTAGYEHHITDFVIDTSTPLTVSGALIPSAEVQTRTEVGPTANGEIQNVSGDYRLIVADPTFNLGHLLALIEITGSGAGNNGTYRIGYVIDEYTVSITRPLGAITPEAGLTWSLIITGDLQGKLAVLSDGVAYFRTQQTTAFMIDPTLAGLHLRRDLVAGTAGNPKNTEAYRLHELSLEPELGVGATAWLLYKYLRVEPLDTFPDAVGIISAGNQLTVTSADVLFSPSMALKHRQGNDYATSRKDRFFVEFTSGANSGTSVEIYEFIDELTVVLNPSNVLTLDAAAQFFVYHLQSYDVATEVNTWEIIKEQIVFDKNTVDLTAMPVQDVAIINYHAHGVREPIDPSSEVFDASSGDTYYSIGMPDPKPAQGKSRTSRDMDLREDPLQITVI